jgi:putative restriction endonuclease
MPRVNWTREETIITLNLYCKIPFNRVSSNHPEIIRISQIIKRSPNAIKMKIGNFGRFDPELRKRGIVALSNGSKLDQIIWDEFNNNWDDLAYESEVLIAKLSNKSLEEITGIEIFDIPEGKERESIVKQRVNQNFFRSTILSCYSSRCCITCLSIPNFLVASHIIPWSKDKKSGLLGGGKGILFFILAVFKTFFCISYYMLIDDNTQDVIKTLVSTSDKIQRLTSTFIKDITTI